MQYAAHLPYWVIITALSGWLIFEKNSAKGQELNLASTQTLKMAGELLERENTSLKIAIEKSFLEYPSPQSEDYNQRAKRLAGLSTRTTQSITTLANLVYEQKADGKAVTSVLQKTINVFQDSMLLLSDYDESLKSAFPDLELNGYELPEAWLWGFLPTARTEEILLILQNIITRIKSSEGAVLNYFSTKTSGADTNCFSGPMVGVSPKNPAPRVGEWYSAEVFAASYTPIDYNLRIRVDGKELEIKDGIATFKRRYTSPGEKKYLAEIIISNPFTKMTNHIKKEFSVTVVDSCR